MIIHSNPKMKYVCLAVLIVLLAVSILAMMDAKTRVLGIICAILGCVFSLRYAIAVGREFCVDEAGISVRWCKKRFDYSWDEVRCYHVRSDDKVTFSRPQYKEAMVFVPKAFRYFKMQPLLYCTIFHPFTVAFVNLGESNSAAPDVYKAEKAHFEALLKRLNVPIIDTGCR